MNIHKVLLFFNFPSNLQLTEGPAKKDNWGQIGTKGDKIPLVKRGCVAQCHDMSHFVAHLSGNPPLVTFDGGAVDVPHIPHGACRH